jgi:hypothetical protein
MKPQPAIKGNRLKVLLDMPRCNYWSTHKGRTVRFFDSQEARDFAKRKGYKDGIHIVIAVGYGLKPRLDALLGKPKKGTK